jgi:hypothetical protein
MIWAEKPLKKQIKATPSEKQADLKNSARRGIDKGLPKKVIVNFSNNENQQN